MNGSCEQPQPSRAGHMQCMRAFTAALYLTQYCPTLISCQRSGGAGLLPALSECALQAFDLIDNSELTPLRELIDNLMR